MSLSKKIRLPAIARESGRCAAFYDYWNAQRGGALMPTTERILDTLPPALAPESYIVEITATKTLVRFQGTGLVASWGFDLTGRDLCAERTKKLQTLTHAHMKIIAGHPCGYVCQAVYTTSRGRDVAANIVRLPIAVQAGRPPRILSYKDEDHVLGETETSWQQFETLDQEWFDIGAGIPAEPPVRLVE